MKTYYHISKVLELVETLNHLQISIMYDAKMPKEVVS